MADRFYASPTCEFDLLAEDILTDSEVLIDGSWLEDDEEDTEE